MEPVHSANELDCAPTITEPTLNSILALQVVVAWAGEALREPARLGWWRTDLVDEAGGGDLFRRLLPKTHSWAGLETIRRAATQADLKARSALGLVSFHDKQGYKIMSSAGQDWQRERDACGMTGKDLTEIIAGKMKILLGQADRPRLRNRAFPFVAFHSDGRHAQDHRIQTNPDAAVVAVDFRLLGNDQDHAHARWIQESDTPALHDRLVWVTARTAPLENTARALVRARRQVHKCQENLLSELRERLTKQLKDNTRLRLP